MPLLKLEIESDEQTIKDLTEEAIKDLTEEAIKDLTGEAIKDLTEEAGKLGETLPDGKGSGRVDRIWTEEEIAISYNDVCMKFFFGDSIPPVPKS